MPDHDELPTPDGPDPIDGGDPTHLRREILRLRDLVLGEQARTEVLDDRVGELESQVEELARVNQQLHTELARNPVTRTLRAIAAPIFRRARRHR